MIGGKIDPPLEAIASVAAAKTGLYPCRFINGIVNEPVATTLAVGAPLIVPNKALVRTAILAIPLVVFPKTNIAKLFKKSAAPLFNRNTPKRIKMNICLEETAIGTP